MRIVIAGAGEVGSYLAKMLSNENHDIIVIDDSHSENLKSLDSHLDLLTIQASPVSLQVLKEAQINHADLFIAVTPYTTENITAAIFAKKLGAHRTVARVDDMEYIINRKFFSEIGVDSLIYPEMLAAKEISDLLRQSGTTKVIDFSGGRLNLFVVRLDEKAPIINKTLAETDKLIDSFDYRAVAITRNSETIIPKGSDRFQLDDMVYFITNHTGVEDVMRYSGKEQHRINRVMILGGSKIGKKTAKELESQFNIKLLEPEKKRSFELADYLDKTLVINTDGKDVDFLREEGIQDMDAFIAVTGNSETNILVCLMAKQLGVKRTIAEIENMDFISLAENIGIETVVNKKLIAASHIYRFTTSPAVASVQCLPGTRAEFLEFVVPKGAKVTRHTLKDVDFPQGAIIAGLVRGKRTLIAKGDCQIMPNDKVVVFTLPHAIKEVVTFFK